MKTKKLIGLAALSCVAVMGLTSCEGAVDESKTVVFYTTAGDTPMVTLNAAKAKFEEENEGWKVNIINGFDYNGLKEKVTSMLSSNTQPSVAFCYPDHVAQYLKTSKVLNLKDYIDNADYGYSEEEWSDFVESYMTEGTSYSVDGIYSIPFARSTEVLYYNKTVLEEEEIAVPKTWSELWAACRKLKEKYPKSVPLGYDSEDNWMITYLEQYAKNENQGNKYYTDGSKTGAEKLLFNCDVAKDFLVELRGYYDEGLFTTKTISGSYCSTLFKKYKASDFASGKAKASDYTGAFLSIGSTGGASKQEPAGAFTAGVAALPGITEESALCISQGPSLVMFDQGNEERAKMTWKFVKVLLTPEIQAQYSIDNGYNPVRKSVYDNETFIEAMEDGTLTNKTILLANDIASKNLFFTSDAFIGSSQAREEIGKSLVNVMKNAGAPATLASKYLKAAYDEAAYYTRRD